MAIAPNREDELIAKVSKLDEEEFEKWLKEQPDADELGAYLVDLLRTESKEDKKNDLHTDG